MRVQPGELITLVGPSGAGKTTLLRLIAGLDAPTSGTIQIDGNDPSRLAPHRRGAALMFQEPVVYPHLNVRDNLAFSARARGVPESTLRPKRDLLADRLGILPLLDRPPSRLSGGERQRVAIGRVLLSGARLLLLDEPFARLDVHLREDVATLIRDWQRAHAPTTLLVTHDPAEAARLADRVGVLEHGRLTAFDTPQTLYEHPPTPTVGQLVGAPAMEFLPVQADSTSFNVSLGKNLEFNSRYIHVHNDANISNGPWLIGYRPVSPAIAVLPIDVPPQPPFLDLLADSVAVEPFGRDRRHVFQPIGSKHTLVVIEPADQPIHPERRVMLRLDLRAVCWFSDVDDGSLSTRDP